MLHEALGEAKQILTDEQLERFVEIIREDAVWYDFFYTELTTGLRRGEICGLQWRALMQMMEGSRFAALYMRSVAEN